MPKDENAPQVKGHSPGNEKFSTILSDTGSQALRTLAAEDFNNENWNELWVKQGIRF